MPSQITLTNTISFAYDIKDIEMYLYLSQKISSKFNWNSARTTKKKRGGEREHTTAVASCNTEVMVHSLFFCIIMKPEKAIRQPNKKPRSLSKAYLLMIIIHTIVDRKRAIWNLVTEER